MQLVLVLYPPAKSAKPVKTEPAKLSAIAGTDIQKITLEAKAAARLGIETAPVREERVASLSGVQKIVPYSSVLYDLQGKTWLYVNLQPLVFVRMPISVDYIEGDKAFLLEGPLVGIKVVTVGVAELYGIETGIKK